MATWPKKDNLYGGETWTCESITDPGTEARLCLAVGDRLQISKTGLGKPKLTPDPNSNWGSSHNKGNPVKLNKKSRSGNDQRRLYEFTVICTTQNGTTENTFFLLEDEPDDEHISILLSNPDDSGAPGGSASFRR